MKNMPKLLFINSVLGFLAFGVVTNAHALLDDWGASSITSVADCPSFCTNFTFGPSLGGAGTAVSGISSISQSRGNARASASLTGNLNSPVLKAEAFASAGFKGAFATAFGVQGYTYNGAGETLTIDISLDGLVSDPEADSLDTRATMEVVIYAPEPFEFISDRGTLDFEIFATPLTQTNALPAATVLQLDHTNPSNDSGQLSWDVNTGDEFYVFALLRARAESGAAATSADAFNTGLISFAGSPDLVAAVTPVPLPAGVWLLGLGLVSMLRARRR